MVTSILQKLIYHIPM
jgi:Listeria-Bacteroides repeat domain (List_Bact_rpt).